MNIRNLTLIFWVSVIGSLLAACSENSSTQSNTSTSKPLLVYCGTDMVDPITRIAQIFEQETDVKVAISSGPSAELYEQIKTSRQGDLYLPGSAYYRDIHLNEGLLGDEVLVGHNQAAFLVKKGNPKNVSAQISEMLRDDLKIGIGNPSGASIGSETKNILDKRDIYTQVFNRLSYLAPESESLNNALKEDKVDLVLNWRATGFFTENRNAVDVIELPTEVAEPKKLLLNYLTVSDNAEQAHQFMEYVASVQGQAIFRSYGFLDSDKKSH